MALAYTQKSGQGQMPQTRRQGKAGCAVRKDAHMCTLPLIMSVILHGHGNKPTPRLGEAMQ